MLEELRVENLLLMERAELRLAPGLNALTGETGAGKTLLAHALDLLLGGRARKGIVRPGAPEAYVEGVFGVPSSLAGSELLPTGAEEIVLARRVWPDGRTRAYVCGRSATLADLQLLGGELLSFYGQHEHRKLMLATAQLDVLDAYCGAAQMALRAELGAVYERMRGIERRIAELGVLDGARDRELDLLTFELQEIEAAEPSEEEGQALTLEQARLRHLETLRAAAEGGAEAIAPDAGIGVAERLAQAAGPLEFAADIDPELRTLADRLEALRYEAEDLGGELRRYTPGLDGGQVGESGGPGASRRSRSVSRCCTAWSASTAARSRRCSPTPSTAESASPSSRTLTRPATPRRRSSDDAATSSRSFLRAGCTIAGSRLPRSLPPPCASASASWRCPTRGSRSR